MGPSHGEVFLGVDIGTQGVRVVALDRSGTLIADAHETLPQREDGNEQSPAEWWRAVRETLRVVALALRSAEPPVRPLALAVTSTSGTVIPLDRDFAPIHDALMYSDRRPRIEAAEIARLAPELGGNISWGLPKIRWFNRQFPEQAPRIHAWRHAADIILGRLTGVWDVTDVTTALKSGFDPAANAWSPALSRLDIDVDLLPRVVPSGAILGPLTSAAVEEVGLPRSVMVTTGMTDGCASQVAAGAVVPGAWNTTIGSTLVVKGVTRQRIVDPAGRLYSHRHPDGYWMPGGASNTGAAWIALDYPGEDLDRLEAEARAVVPTGLISYPLRQTGERFPFLAPAARGFDPVGVAEPRRFAARLEGVAYLERMSFDLIEELAGEPVRAVYTAGGGSRSHLWLQIRADVLGRPIYRTRYPDAAAGAAIIAAAGVGFASLSEAAGAMTRIEQTVEPGDWVGMYDEGYGRFRAELVRRNYLGAEVTA